MKIRNWNNEDVEYCESKGGKIAFVDYKDNLISSNCGMWPPPELSYKLYKSNHEKDFVSAKIREKLGYYTDLQSINRRKLATVSAKSI